MYMYPNLTYMYMYLNLAYMYLNTTYSFLYMYLILTYKNVHVPLSLTRLKSGFEESRGSYMTQMEVYSQYIKSCADANQSKMLNLSDFTKCIKYVTTLIIQKLAKICSTNNYHSVNNSPIPSGSLLANY